jgi:plastocyanin
MLARRKQYRAHKYCQSSVMLLNLAMILLIMAPSFHRQVEPQLPGGLKETYYLVPYVHAVLGTIAELLGLYIVLVAATSIIPKKLRFNRYKPWMRTALALWWLVIAIGIGTYYVWYVRGERAVVTQSSATSPSAASTAPRAVIKISNFQFEPAALTVEAGTVVEWVDEKGRHTVSADDDSFKSDVLGAGGRFEHKFDTPGVYRYYCEFHGDKHGKEMAGVVTVK